MLTRTQLLAQIEWAEKWLRLPEPDLPGSLTHAKCSSVWDSATEALFDLTLEQARFEATPGGMKFNHFEEAE